MKNLDGALKVPSPRQEKERLETLHAYKILDTEAEECFDKLTQLASKLLNVPISVISLVDKDRIWIKSKYGVSFQEVAREPGLCASAIYSNDIYVVGDLRNDPRTKKNSLVTGNPGLQFYAGIPLKNNQGNAIGVFCVIDHKTRYFNSDQQQALKLLGEVAMNLIEMRRELNDLRAQKA